MALRLRRGMLGRMSGRSSQPLSLSTPVEDREELNRLWTVALPLALALTAVVLAYTVPEWSTEVFLTEGWGPVELAHFFIPLAAAAIAVQALAALPRGASTGLRLWLAALALGTLYIAGEEQSWGQHFFSWSTPDYWAELNRQQETNLHNVSSWLNHKPRVLLQLAIIAGTIVLPIAAARGRLAGLRRRMALVLPGRSARPLGWLAIFYMLWDHLAKNAGFPELSTRDAEIQETFIYGFLLVHAVELRNRIRRAAPAGGALATGSAER